MTIRLVDLPLPVVRALDAGEVDTAAGLIDLEIPDEFAGHTDIWAYMMTLLDGRPDNAGWTMNAVVRDDVIVGNTGFKGAPDEHGMIELGYGILMPHRGQGLAVAAARMLIERAEQNAAVDLVQVTINPANVASIAVATRAGFLSAGDRQHPRWGRQLVFTHPRRRATP